MFRRMAIGKLAVQQIVLQAYWEWIQQIRLHRRDLPDFPDQLDTYTTKRKEAEKSTNHN